MSDWKSGSIASRQTPSKALVKIVTNSAAEACACMVERTKAGTEKVGDLYISRKKRGAWVSDCPDANKIASPLEMRVLLKRKCLWHDKEIADLRAHTEATRWLTNFFCLFQDDSAESGSDRVSFSCSQSYFYKTLLLFACLFRNSSNNAQMGCMRYRRCVIVVMRYKVFNVTHQEARADEAPF